MHIKKHARKKTIENNTIQQKERDIIKSLEYIFIKLGFGEKLRSSGQEKVNKKPPNKIKKSLNYLKDLRNFKKNPAEYNHNEFENHMKNIFKA